jgi:hypothetical protein
LQESIPACEHDLLALHAMPREASEGVVMWAKGKLKYGNTKVSHAGYSFASKGEAGCFDMLSLLEKAGKIRDIKTQVTVYLTRARIIYKPDFQFEDLELAQTVYAEFKGFETSDWRIKRRLWMYYGPARLRIYKGAMTLVEEIIPETDSESWVDAKGYVAK